MKNIINKILLGLLISFGIISCKDSLELTPEDYFGEGNYWNTESHFVNNMNALHSRFRSHMFTFYRLGEMRGGGLSNQAIFPVSLNELNLIDQDISESAPGVTNWADLYNSILQVNLFIYKTNESTFIAEDKRSYMLGQAHAMRAYYYFQLLRTYGGVPLRIDPDITLEKPDAVELRLERASEQEVFDQVKSDIDESIKFFASEKSKDASMWNPDAAKMLKGEIYLWSAKVYDNLQDATIAKNTLNDITGYNLMEDFAETFSTKKNNEIIFSIHHQYREAEMGGVSAFLYDNFSFNNLYYKDTVDVNAETLGDELQLAQTNGQPIQRYRYKYEIFQAYDPADTRRDATFYDFYSIDRNQSPQTVTARNTVLVKFLGEILNNTRHFTNDWPIYREAERLLMLAEITNLLDEDPSNYIQQIRDRAYNGNDTNPFVSGSKDANELAIFQERSKEFVFEGKRWYDLRRMKISGKPLAFKSNGHPYGVLDETTESYKLLWPIERAIWTDDPLVEQTPGYSSTKP